MALIASIDGVTRNIYLHADTVGASINPIDIYKEMRTFRRTNEELRKYDVFMSAFGNVSKGGGKATERYVRLNAGTRLIPFDITHQLTINGTIITDDGQEGIACFDRTPLTSTTVVDINYVPPQVEVITVVGGSGLDAAQDTLLTKIGDDTDRLNKAVWLDTDLVAIGDGSQKTPFNTLNDALDLLEVEGLGRLYTKSDILLTRNLKNVVVEGIGIPEFDANGFDLKGTELNKVKFKGTYLDSVIVRDCVMLDGSYMNGVFENSIYQGTSTCIDGGQVLMKDCASNVAGLGRPTISMNGTGSSKLSVRSWNGGFNLADCNNVTDEVTIEVNRGSVELLSSCTNGIIVARTDGRFVDSSNGSTVTQETFNQDLHKAEFNKRTWDKVGDTVTLYEDDGITPFKVFDVNDDMSEITPQ